jgi:hypothetical protein
MVGAILYPASKLSANVMSGLVLFERYINAPMTLRYVYLGLNTFSTSSRGLNGPVLVSKALTIIGVLDG